MDSIQGAFLPQNTCACCGAGLHNNYEHLWCCLANLPIHTLEMRAQWHRGYNEEKDPTAAKPAFDPNNEESRAYRMGFKCSEILRLITAGVEGSAEQTAETAPGRRQNGDSFLELS